jgi:hypothetical protein
VQNDLAEHPVSDLVGGLVVVADLLAFLSGPVFTCHPPQHEIHVRALSQQHGQNAFWKWSEQPLRELFSLDRDDTERGIFGGLAFRKAAPA